MLDQRTGKPRTSGAPDSALGKTVGESVKHPLWVDAYVQANLDQGYGYLDVRGALVRELGDDFHDFAEIPENASTLHFTRPKDPTHPVEELKVSQILTWLHFRSPLASPAAIRQESSRVVEAVCALTGVRSFTRQGLRVQLAFPTAEISTALRMIRTHVLPESSGWDRLGQVATVGLVVELHARRLKAIVRLNPVRRVEVQVMVSDPRDPDATEPPSPTPPHFGVLLDVDLYDDRPSESTDSRPHLNRALEYLDSEIVPFATRFLEESP